MNEQLLIAMRDTLLGLAEKHGIPVGDKVVEFFEDVVSAELDSLD